MTLPVYYIDAFSDTHFAGNPAAVVPLQGWLDDALMQRIAAELNLSETAFLVPAGEPGHYGLRWFTPTTEVDLCGHATLASAWVLRHRCADAAPELYFHTASGTLSVHMTGPQLRMDFPSRPATPWQGDRDLLLQALGLSRAEAILAARDIMVVVHDADTVTSLAPDFSALAQIDAFAVMVTAPGKDCDFVSRFFAPRQGINEDPVTGSAHCTLVPYWAQQLGRPALFARQLSARGGALWCTLQGDRVTIAGDAVCSMEGQLLLDAAGVPTPTSEVQPKGQGALPE